MQILFTERGEPEYPLKVNGDVHSASREEAECLAGGWGAGGEKRDTCLYRHFVLHSHLTYFFFFNENILDGNQKSWVPVLQIPVTSLFTLVSLSLTLITTQFSSSKSRHKGDLCKLDGVGALNYYLLCTQFISTDNH